MKLGIVAAILGGIGIFLAGCGAFGPLTSGPPPGGVRVEAPGAIAAYYDAGSGWTPATNPAYFTFSAGGAYRVLIECNNNRLRVYALTATEVNDLYEPCPDATSPIAFQVQYDVSGVTGAAGAVLVHRASDFFPTDQASGTTGTIAVSQGVAGVQDLVILAIDSNGNLLAARMIPGVNVQNGQAYGPYSVTNADAVGQSETFPDPSTAPGYPAGWAYGWAVHAVTPGGTIVLSDTDTPGDMNYYTYPFAERYLFAAYVTNTLDERLDYFENRDPGAGPPSLAFPARINAASYAGGQFTNLINDPALTSYVFTLESGVWEREEKVTKGYLGSATSYALQALPPGYPTTWNARRAEYLSANKPLQAMLDTARQHGPRGVFLVDGLVLKRASKTW